MKPDEALRKLREAVESDDPEQLKAMPELLGRGLVALNERFKDLETSLSRKAEEFETRVKEISLAAQGRDKLRVIMDAPSPHLPPQCSVREAIRTPGFYTRSLKGNMEAGDARVLQMQEVNDRLALGVVLHRFFNRGDQRSDKAIMEANFPDHLRQWDGLTKDFQRAMDAATTAEGLEFVAPTQLSSRLHEKFRLQLKVQELFGAPTRMPSNPYKSPNEGADAEAYGVDEATGDSLTATVTLSTPGTGDSTMTAKGAAAGTLHSRQLTDLSIISMDSYIIKKHSLAHAVAQEKATLNGDTTATHMDSDTTASADFRKRYVGLRKMALGGPAAVDCGNWDQAVELLGKVRTNMGKYGVAAQQLAWVWSIKGYAKLRLLPEHRTWDKYGPLAANVTGEVAKHDGISVIVSEWNRDDLNAQGVYDGAVTSKTAGLLVFPGEFEVGEWVAFETVVAKELALRSMQTYVQSYMARAFRCQLDYTTEGVVGIGYNIDIS